MKRAEFVYYKYENKKGDYIPCRIYTRSDGKSYFQHFKMNFKNNKYEIDFTNISEPVFDIKEYEEKHNLTRIDKEELEQLKKSVAESRRI